MSMLSSTNRIASTIVNWKRRFSTPRRLRYDGADSPPKVAPRPEPRDCMRIEAMSPTAMRTSARKRMRFPRSRIDS